MSFCLLKSCPSSQPSCKTTQDNCNIYGFFLHIGGINKYFVSTRPITTNWSISHIPSQTTKVTPSTVSTSADADPCSHFEGRSGACDTFLQNWPLRRVYSLLLLTPVFTVAYIFGSVGKISVIRVTIPIMKDRTVTPAARKNIAQVRSHCHFPRL